ncbi:MutS-related protein [Cecembia lonarensis]|uniref:DNA mismatch repair protein mutS n=1 Tax=Cecembia lonarensis (strain CCUG 58316 / KCTC 22772 / LW9) TaxID=1225176 RepID=K1L800_CECL9|nr:DNA mismatch repair protein [Cecembia lonarensis]EKB50781.1 DNA mismatch repair protein mutS [Cecembia lonarensis LW9]
MKLPQILYPLPKTLQSIGKKSALLAISRLLLFFTMLALLIIGLSDNPLFLIPLPFLTLLFAALINRFNHYKDLKAFILELQLIESEEAQRKSRVLHDFDPGIEFLEKSHPFCNDLDLFGQHSLFQLLNRTVSVGGRALLAQSMKAQIAPNLAKKQFKAIEELRKSPELLQHFQAAGRAFFKEEKDKRGFYQWLKEPENWHPFYLALMLIGPIGGITLMSGVLLADWPAAWLGLWVLFGTGLLSLVYKNLNIATKIWPSAGDIKTFRIWSEFLEKETFTDPKLQEIHLQFADGQFSKAINSLEQISFLIQNRLNLVYVILNFLFWLDFFLLWQLKGWKKNHGTDLSKIEKIFEQWQVLISLAAFSNSETLQGRLEWTNADQFECSNIRHPLLKANQAIGNDFVLQHYKKTVLLTGANMSGKTTFMRTLGINLVMANLGLRPMAESMTVGNYSLYTSMRNTDNLGESVSSFYAELFRIRQVLQAAEKGESVFFLMDEILKGTNTKDRILGSEALIKQLAASKAKGIISTHDIELSDLEKDLAYLVNYSFHSEISDDEILFDYKLKTGPCPSFNAHKLMELMGVRF